MTTGDRGTPPTRVLLAIGTAYYTDPAYQESKERCEEPDSLSQSVPRSLLAVVEAFGRSRVDVKLPSPGYLLNPHPDDQLRQVLAEAGNRGDIITIYYTGHGEKFDREGYVLVTSDFTKTQRWKGFKVREVPELVVRRRDDGEIDPDQPLTLLILDCCFSAGGGLEVLREALFEGTHPNLWVWATAGKTQYATSGVFAEALADLLRQPLVGPSTEYIPLDTVLNVIDDALRGTDQRAEIFPPPGFSLFPGFFPNREYIPQVSGLTVAEQHWISKARGGPETADSGAGFYLTGRTGRLRAAADLAHWIAVPAAGRVVFVTGGPGTGKSALLSLPVLLTDPASRDLLLTGTREGSLAHQVAALLPVDTSVVAIHARGLNTDQVAQAIGASLGRSATSAMALLESLDSDPLPQSQVVIVDAVDEATAPARLRDSLLLALAEQHSVRIVVGARPHVVRTARCADTETTVIDLNTETYQDPSALTEYVRQLLTAGREPGVTTPYQDDSENGTTAIVATAIADRATSRSDIAHSRVESFLIARVIALAVRARPGPIDTAAEAWIQRLPDGLAEAFQEDLDRLCERIPAARILLEALAWARGPGLPWETIWVPVARALALLRGDMELNTTLSDDDVRRLLDRAGAYVVEDIGPGGRSVFRPFHDRLADYLLARSSMSGEERAATEAAVVGALLDTLGPTGGRRWDRAHPYLRTYLAEHALAAGPEVFSAVLREGAFLATAESATLTPLLSQAPPELKPIVRSYRRARPQLGEDPAANAAYLQEAALAVSGTPISFDGTAIAPTYHPKWARVHLDQSLLTLTGHTVLVNSVAFGTGTSGRPLLASVGFDSTIRLWNPDTGNPVREPLTGHTGFVWSLAFGTGADGRPLLASGGGDSTVRVWDPDTGDLLIEPMTGHIGAVNSVAFGTGTDGQPLLASAGSEGTVRVWNPDTGDPVTAPLTGHGRWVWSVAFGTGAGGRTLLVSTGEDGTVRVWDPHTGDPVHKPLTGHTGAVYSVAFGTGADGRPLLASAGFDGTVRLWDPDTGDPVTEPLTGHTGAVYSVAFGTGADGRPLLASAGVDTSLRVWDPQTGTPAGPPLTGHTEMVRSVAFGTGAGGRPLLASAGYDATARVWDPETGGGIPERRTAHVGVVNSVAFGIGAGGRPLLASAGYDGTVRVWDRDTGEPIITPLTWHNDAANSVAFGSGAGGRPLLASAGYDGTVCVWDPDTGEPVTAPLRGHNDSVNSVAFGTGADGRPLLASAGDDATIRLWDPDTGEPVTEPLTGDSGWVHSVAFGTGSGGRPLLASGASDGTIWVWDPDTGEPVAAPLRRHNDSVTSLASGATDGTIWGRDPVTGEPVTAPLRGHNDSVNSVALGTGANGRPLLASAGDDATIRLWDPDTGESVTELTGHSELVRSVIFGAGPGGRPLLVSGSADRTVRLWDLHTGGLALTIRRRADVTALASDGSLLAIGDQEGLCVIDVGVCDQLRRPAKG
jgi:WD40 repeat protein